MKGIYLLSRLFYKALLDSFFGFEVKGRENIPEKGPFIIAANHVSYADPVVVGVSCNKIPVTFMAKKELFDVPIFGAWIKAVGCIPIMRHSGDSKPLKKVMQKLKNGGALAIFPEGRRSPDGRLQKAEAGIGLIAMKTGAPIIPVYVSGTDKALPRGKKIARPCKITATIGKPVDIIESLKFSDRRKVYESVAEKAILAIAKLKDGHKDG